MNFQVVLISKLFFFPTKASRCFGTFSTFKASILRKFLELASWSDVTSQRTMLGLDPSNSSSTSKTARI